MSFGFLCLFSWETGTFAPFCDLWLTREKHQQKFNLDFYFMPDYTEPISVHTGLQMLCSSFVMLNTQTLNWRHIVSSVSMKFAVVSI